MLMLGFELVHEAIANRQTLRANGATIPASARTASSMAPIC
jgi:hypothetical protein